VADEPAGRIPLAAELHLDEYALPGDIAQRIAEQQLVVAHAVEVAGVKQRDAGVDRGVDRSQALTVISPAIDARHAHQAEPGPGHNRAAPTQRGRLQHDLDLL
jgi:hypothetical protein